MVWWLKFSRNWHKCEHTIHFFIFSQKTLNSWNSSIPVLSTWFIVKGNMWTDMVKTKTEQLSRACAHACVIVRIRPSGWWYCGRYWESDHQTWSLFLKIKHIWADVKHQKWFAGLHFYPFDRWFVTLCEEEKCNPDVVYSGGADLRLLRTPFSICWSSLTEIAWSCKHGENYIYILNHKILLLLSQKTLSGYWVCVTGWNEQSDLM